MKLASLALLCCFAIACILAARPVHSVPAFARRTGQQCQMCHFRAPELNVDGHNFLLRGLREEPPQKPADDGQPADTSQPLGVPLSLNWADYLSIVGHHGFFAQTGERSQFDAGAIDLWVAGPINPHWSALVNPSFDIENGGADVDSGYGQYVSRWSNKFGSAELGQKLPYAIELDQGGPSLTLSTPLVLSTPADTGNTWTPTSFLRGIEAGGVGIQTWNVYFNAGNPRLEDSQTSQVGFENNIDLSASAEWFPGFLDSSITAYGYWGHAWLSPDATRNPFHRVGGFFNIYGPQTKGTLGYLAGSDRSINGGDLDTSGGFALVEQLVNDQWSAYLRYDWFRQDLDDGDSRRISGPTVGTSYWAATQLWLTMELQWVNTSDERPTNLFATQLTWAF